MRKLYGLLLLLIAFQFSQSQVVINSTGTAYTQNFNSLAQTGNTNTWADNSTIPGWYSTQNSYAATNGTGTAGGLYSYGASTAPGDVTDRALGLLSSGSTNFRFGVQVKNSTGSSVTSFALNFTGEEWRQNTASQKLVFEYSTDATSLVTGSWNAVTTLDFTGTVTGSAGSLDGNAAANRTPVSGTVAAAVPNDGTIWFRWTKSGTNSMGLAVDDVSITASNETVNSITTGTVSTPPFCVDASSASSGTVGYAATGTYNTTFTAYLSDAAGSFSSPLSIGSTAVNANNPSGTINVTIPAGTASGTGYKIRVDASTPAVTGSPSTAFEIVAGAKNITGASAVTGNAQATINWTNPSSCFDEIMIVAKASASVATLPSGDGSAYTASNTFGSGTAFDGGYVVYKGTANPQTITGLTNRTLYYFKIFTRKGSNWSPGVEVSTTPSVQPGPGDILINQLSPDYNAAADEYIELVNKTNNNIDLSGFAVKYQSASGGTTTSLGTLNGTLPPRSYWLLSPNTTVTAGMTNNLARDGAVAPGMAGTSGQVALIRLSDNTIIDAVGYGTITGGTYTETAAASSPPSNGGIKRNPDGTDNNNNAADFVTVTNANILLRNSAVESPLPVKFANLSAVQRGTTVSISWSNLTESDISEYTVERSANGVNFIDVIKVKPVNNHQNQADYIVTDAAPVKGISFYRIRSTELGGKTSFSSILKLNASVVTTDLLIYPNPVKGEATVQFSNLPSGQYTVRIVGTDGRVMISQSLSLFEGSHTETLSFSNLPSGAYTLQLIGATNFQQKFVKE